MTQTPPQQQPETRPKPQVGFEWRDWLEYLAVTDIPEADKQALIEALWAIVLGFVDLGFEVKSPQETCGQALNLSAALAAAVVNSEETEEDAA